MIKLILFFMALPAFACEPHLVAECSRYEIYQEICPLPATPDSRDQVSEHFLVQLINEGDAHEMELVGAAGKHEMFTLLLSTVWFINLDVERGFGKQVKYVTSVDHARRPGLRETCTPVN